MPGKPPLLQSPAHGTASVILGQGGFLVPSPRLVTPGKPVQMKLGLLHQGAPSLMRDVYSVVYSSDIY